MRHEKVIEPEVIGFLPRQPRRIGSLIIAIDCGRIIGPQRYMEDVPTLLADDTSAKPGSVFRGESEVLKKQQCHTEGIRLDEPLFREVNVRLFTARLAAYSPR